MTRYSIIEPSGYTSIVKIGISIFPENETLKHFLGSIKPILFIDFMTSSIEKRRYGLENMSLLFFQEMDWEDKEGLEINEDDISIYLYDGRPNNTVINEDLFRNILYDYSVSLLEVYRNDKGISSNWIFEMENKIEQLKNKIVHLRDEKDGVYIWKK